MLLIEGEIELYLMLLKAVGMMNCMVLSAAGLTITGAVILILVPEQCPKVRARDMQG